MKTQNIYLNKLREQYKRYKDFDKKDYVHITKKHYNDYKAIRAFCIDTNLLSFDEIETMEEEVELKNN